jgi:cation:H+ antiporter
MLTTLVIPILAILLKVYAGLGKRTAAFRLNYRDVRGDLFFFVAAYSVALACVFIPSRLAHAVAAVGLIGLYLYYVKLKFSETDEEGGEGGGLEPLLFARKAAIPSFGLIGIQAFIGLAGLALGAHLFVLAAETIAGALSISPLILALLVAPLATELPEMSNSFLWLYRKKDRLAVGNVTGAIVFQGTIPVSIGLLGTDWTLAPTALITMVLAVTAATFLLAQAAWGALWRPWLLSGSAILYIGYVVFLYSW